jgi:hypothetical protein
MTCLVLRFVSWFEFAFAGHEAISTRQTKPAWLGYWVNFSPSVLMTSA